ncbi:MAG TPA: nickel pincer cofactor biosynthesis protein LarB [Thermoplasmata archaeon]|nr:nickel pincer cofactor biosynthesis protein LarB [Thermoplasmata archaeon]
MPTAAAGRTGRKNPREIEVHGVARLDRDRGRRVGVPEVILGEGKSVHHLEAIVRVLAARGLGAIISRITPAQRRALEAAARSGLPLRPLAHGRLYRLAGPLGVSYHRGRVALLTAGTSDVPLADECGALLTELGISVASAHDVGVAGIHRLMRALERLEQRRPDLYIVFAGREGALPTVVAGLVRAPVIGVPTSVGYGRGGRGEAALAAMLQSCAPIAVVNIDAAVPAALFAAQRFAVRPARRPGTRGRRSPGRRPYRPP